MTDKPLLRAELKRRRTTVHEAAGDIAARQAADHFITRFPAEPDAEVALYYPFGTEIDPMPLAEKLGAAGCKLSLPVVMAEAAPLVFRRWTPGDEMVEGHYGILSPSPKASAVRPTLIVVPLLGFSADGYRLGYGGGFYDRTLAELAEKGGARAIGLAYADQQCALEPESHDWPLEAVVTEKGVVGAGAS